jgi:RNA polymerase sigma factor (sigma-70 family)
MKRFEELFAPHMDAAYNLARWLTGDERAAQDVVQASAFRAFRFVHHFVDGNPKAWFLTIVRHESYGWLKASTRGRWVALGDEIAEDDLALSHAQTPELLAMHAEHAALLQRALQALAPAFREVIVLKEFEDMSYKDIAQVVDIPLGTVMSRLARARSMLKLELLKLHAHD